MAEQSAHAVVLGAGIAGLLAARVLSEFYASVTVVERDVLPANAERRPGVPQGRHLHSLLSRGTQAIGELFPGLLGELGAAGAVVDDGEDLSRLYLRVGGYELTPPGRLADPAPLVAYQASRPFLEFHLRRRVGMLDNVVILDRRNVVAPVLTGGAVTGIRIIERDTGTASTLAADLVVDASGRASRTARFLAGEGFGAVPEEKIASIGGYSSQLLSIPPGHIAQRMAYVSQSGRVPGAMMVAYERDTWMLSIASPDKYGGPPEDFTAILHSAEQLLPPEIMAGVREATRVGDTAISRNTAGVWRRYDRMPHLPTGLVILGDALCSFNPLHGQGMTMAALQAFALRDCLRAGHADLPQRFHRAAAECIAPVWAANRANDQHPQATGEGSVTRRVNGWIQRAVLRAASTDVVVAERILRVRGLIDPPARLREPAFFARIMMANIRIAHPAWCVAVAAYSSLVGGTARRRGPAFSQNTAV